jgi:hypothetical protein
MLQKHPFKSEVDYAKPELLLILLIVRSYSYLTWRWTWGPWRISPYTRPHNKNAKIENYLFLEN